VAEGDAGCEGDSVADCENVGDCDGVACCECVIDGVPLGDGDRVGVPVGVAACEGDGVCVSDGETEGGWTEREADCEGVEVGLVTPIVVTGWSDGENARPRATRACLEPVFASPRWSSDAR
jgi:hypothetical protein